MYLAEDASPIVRSPRCSRRSSPEALAQIGIRDVGRTNYVHAAIEAAARRLTPGQDARAEIAAVAAFTVAGVRALAPASSQS